MSAIEDLERRIADFYAAEAPPRAPDWVLRAALETVDTIHQRGRLRGAARRLPRMNLLIRMAYATLAVLVIGATAVIVLKPGQSSSTVGGPTSTPSPPAGWSPDGSLILAWPLLGDAANADAPLAPGTYRLGPAFPASMTFVAPPGWVGCSASPLELSVCSSDTSGMGFMIVSNVVADPCRAAMRFPPVGPSVDDLVTAISSLDGFVATTPEDVVIDGYHGKAFTLTAPASPACELSTWGNAERTNGVGPGEVNLLRILDVDGVRVLIAAAYRPTADAPDPPMELEQMLGSVRLVP